MNNLSFNEIDQVSCVECIEYFPLKVVFDPSFGGNHFIGFYGGDNNLLEFTVSSANTVKRLQVVSCKNYEIIDSNFAPPHPAQSGCINLNYPQHNDCDSFKMSVYTDCIDIRISTKSATKYYAMSQVMFGMDDNEELVSLIITNLSHEEIAHTIFELQAD